MTTMRLTAEGYVLELSEGEVKELRCYVRAGRLFVEAWGAPEAWPPELLTELVTPRRPLAIAQVSYAQVLDFLHMLARVTAE